MPDSIMKPTIAIYGIPDRNQFENPGFTHDHSICTMQNGRIETYLQLERWSRRKYDNTLQNHIENFIDRGLINEPYNADWVFVNSFAGNAFLSRNGRIRFETAPRKGLMTGLAPGCGWVQKNDCEGKEINAFSIDHELAHVCSNLPFHGIFRDNSLMIHFDGGASLGNFSAFQFKGGKINLLEYHWDLSYLSKFYNDNALVFAMLNHRPGEHCAVPGKLMGFATMGEANEDLMLWLKENGWFREIWNDHSLFMNKAKDDFGWEGSIGNTQDVFLQNLAASFQRTFENDWINYLIQLQEKVNADYLYLSGGCALNIVANTRIVNSGLFQDVFIPPCPGDSGLSIGAAAFFEWQKYGRLVLHSPYQNNGGLTPSSAIMETEILLLIAEEIAQGSVAGICNGNAEAGPRALGNRSIIARPDSKALTQKVSMVCKGREWYRPVAPVMLEKNAMRLTGLSSIHHLSKYMLLDFPIPSENQATIEGVVHTNGTSRIQTLFSRQDNPFLWDLLTILDEKFNIPALINTSFNTQGEPIVHTPEQAFSAATKMGLDILVIDYKLHRIQKNIHV